MRRHERRPDRSHGRTLASALLVDVLTLSTILVALAVAYASRAALADAGSGLAAVAAGLAARWYPLEGAA